MCLTLTAPKLPDTHPETFTAYKVYAKVGSTLNSPHNAQATYGHLTRPGRYAIVPANNCIALYPQGEAPRYVVARRGAANAPVPLDKEWIGFDLDIIGFHVIATELEANAYKEWLDKSLQQRIKQLEIEPTNDLTAEEAKRIQYVVVPIEVKRDEVYAVGTTPFGDTEADGRPTSQAQTYVTSAIEFSTTDWWKVTGTLFGDAAMDFLEKSFGFDTDNDAKTRKDWSDAWDKQADAEKDTPPAPANNTP